MKIGCAIAPKVPSSAPAIMRHVQVARTVLAKADHSRKPLVAGLTLDGTTRRVQVTALDTKRTNQGRRARKVAIDFDVLVWALVAHHELLVRSVKIQRGRTRT